MTDHEKRIENFSWGKPENEVNKRIPVNGYG